MIVRTFEYLGFFLIVFSKTEEVLAYFLNPYQNDGNKQCVLPNTVVT